MHQPQLLDLTSNIILENQKYNLYFDDCVSALDETHIAIYVPTTER